jgi:hypothetical protein
VAVRPEAKAGMEVLLQTVVWSWILVSIWRVASNMDMNNGTSIACKMMMDMGR